MKKILFFSVFIFFSVFGFGQTSNPQANSSVSSDTAKETMPEFPKEYGTFLTYLHDSIKYPVKENEEEIGGTVYISFIIEKDGSITDVKPVREISGAPELTQEAIRVISSMPKWKPGTRNGIPIKIEMTMPVRFVPGQVFPDKKKSKKH